MYVIVHRPWQSNSLKTGAHFLVNRFQLETSYKFRYSDVELQNASGEGGKGPPKPSKKAFKGKAESPQASAGQKLFRQNAKSDASNEGPISENGHREDL